MRIRYVVSACLAGQRCRYDGGDTTCQAVLRLVEEGRAVPACPECLGGLSTPRTPCERAGGRVVSRDGQDLSGPFERGAALAVDLAKKENCTAAILKSRSPSCGIGLIYDGAFSGRLCAGDGVWAALLRHEGFTLFSEEQLPEEVLRPGSCTTPGAD